MIGCQGSFHTDMIDHDPTLVISPFLTRDLAETILLQPYDGEYDLIGSRGDAFLKYQPLKTRENKVFGFSINRYNCFPSMAVLKPVRSLNPKPPSSLLRNNLSHGFQCISFVFPPGLHQNCATALVNFLFLSLVSDSRTSHDLARL